MTILPANSNLNAARRAKADEFYTLFPEVEREVLAYVDFDPDTFRGKTILLPCDDPEWSAFTKFFALKFDDLGLKRLISTSYNPGGRGKLYILDHDTAGDRRVNMDDLRREWLGEDGDFRSWEVCALRDEADVIITNPPFSLFREFLAWIMEADKKFLIIGSMNAITYKETFPLLRSNRMWMGATSKGQDMVFAVPDGAVVSDADRAKAARLGYVGDYTRLGNACWYTNIDHAGRHQVLDFMTTAECLHFAPKMKGRGLVEYERYDNYDAIEVPHYKAIPSDYPGVMGVPVSFFYRYTPEQFEIVGISENGNRAPAASLRVPGHDKYDRPYIDGRRMYSRVFIQHRMPTSTAN